MFKKIHVKYYLNHAGWMLLSSGLLEWLKGRREEKIITMLRDHARKVYDCVLELEKVIKLFSDGKISEAKLGIKRISEIESEADSIRKRIMTLLTEGTLSSAYREDLAHLTKRLDSVANFANAAARRLSLLDENIVINDAEFKKKILKMMEDVVKCVGKMYEMVIRLGKDPVGRIIEYADAVDRLEHVVDESHMDVRRHLVKMSWEQLKTPFNAITLHTFIECVENIADFSEDTAEFVRIVAIKVR